MCAASGLSTGDLCTLADWLKQCEIETVAMESTGVYWILLYELLVERGFKVLLVDARQSKNVPGRKTDVLDCRMTGVDLTQIDSIL
jgi:transposase